MMAEPADGDDARPRPYGWLGLPLSLAAILLIGLLLSAGVLAVAFACLVAIDGWTDAAIRVSGLREAAAGNPGAAETLLIALSILFYVAVATGVCILARVRGGRSWRDLIGWTPWRFAEHARVFIALAVLTILYSFAADVALGVYHPAAKEWVTLPHGGVAVALFAILAVGAAPLAEELVFRGWLYTALRAKWSIWPSLLLTSALFAIAHWESTHLYALAVFPVGLALGWVRERVGTLKASIGLHAFYNGIAVALLAFGF